MELPAMAGSAVEPASQAPITSALTEAVRNSPAPSGEDSTDKDKSDFEVQTSKHVQSVDASVFQVSVITLCVVLSGIPCHCSLVKVLMFSFLPIVNPLWLLLPIVLLLRKRRAVPTTCLPFPMYCYVAYGDVHKHLIFSMCFLTCITTRTCIYMASRVCVEHFNDAIVQRLGEWSHVCHFYRIIFRWSIILHWTFVLSLVLFTCAHSARDS